MSDHGLLERGRECFRRQEWGEAYVALLAADRESALGLDDLERLGVAAELTGRDDESVDSRTRAYREALRLGERSRAARSAFWIAFGLLNRGEMSQCQGWLTRGQRAVDEGGADCVERGYLLVPVALQSLGGGDPAAAYGKFEQIAEIAERFGDRDLMTLSRLGRGQASILSGELEAGVSFLDEAMVAVTAREVSPTVVGIVYCGAIEACQWTFDLRRAREWTAALSRWCEAQPDLVRYRGECMIHRAEIMQIQGDWEDAVGEAREACERLSGKPVVGAATYLEAELERLRGNFSAAEEAYRRANERGRVPQPGLALLRLAQGRAGPARAAIQRALSESVGRIARSGLLPAYVEIALEAGDVTAARQAADELTAIAREFDAPLLRARAAQANGAVLLSEGDAAAALSALRDACGVWQELDSPYEAARARCLIGAACRSLGDEDGAEMELDLARKTFKQLGAGPDLDRVASISATEKKRSDGAAGLTPREVEVLRLVASGRTNRAIADDLALSERTVARHVSNIFGKLELSSRAAATAYAYEHDLV